MKKFIPLLALCLAACTQVDTTRDLDDYTDCITVSVDTITGHATASSLASYHVEGDLVTSTFSLEMKNVQLYEGANLLSGTISNLIQFYQEKSTDNNRALYTFFRQDPQQTRTDGDLTIENMRFGWLTSTFWLNFTSGQYRLWATPRVRNLYANENFIQGPLGSATEHAIDPAYRITLDPEQKTATFKVTGVKFPQTPNDISQTLSFSSMEWRDLPVEFTKEGFTIAADSFVPIIDGELAPGHTITNFTASIAANYEGTKQVSYHMLNQNGDQITIVTNFVIKIED